MGQFRVLNLFKPFQKIIPEVQSPEGRRIPFRCGSGRIYGCRYRGIVHCGLPSVPMASGSAAEPELSPAGTG